MKIIKIIGIILGILIIILAVLNSYFRVSMGPNMPSTGIIVYQFWSDNYKYYSSSADYSVKATNLIMKHGKNITLNSGRINEDKKNAIIYLKKALEFAIKVEDSYLAESHSSCKLTPLVVRQKGRISRSKSSQISKF